MPIKGLDKLAQQSLQDKLDYEVIYERNINVAVTKISSDIIKTKSSLLDLNHNMRVDLIMRVSDRCIVDARCQMVKVPFEVCALTAHLISKVIGLKIERGITGQIRSRLAGAKGCTHLYELTIEAIRMSSNVLMGFATGDEKEWRERRMTDAEFIDKAKECLKDSCLPFSAGTADTDNA
ncbi:MAG TPA: DUF2889 domain-containing protein [Bacteroidetes bacterium]|nr:DUF2889 domain-containing protein [Bacteroidota bacterium]HEX04392.1 DUF2889 domain-containing protein [Bacteroidota bacterium]